jgi:hypothetical protein
MKQQLNSSSKASMIERLDHMPPNQAVTAKLKCLLDLNILKCFKSGAKSTQSLNLDPQTQMLKDRSGKLQSSKISAQTLIGVNTEQI